MSGDHPPLRRSAPNALPDQAIPNVLGGAEVHVAPTRDTDEVDDDSPARAERWESPAATTPDEGVELEEAAARLYALAQSFATRSEAVEARLLEGFQEEAAPLADQCGDLVIRDADDERISFRADGSFSGEVVPEDSPTSWRPLETALDIVDFYDPSDLFADLADRLAAAHPNVGNLGVEDAGPRLRQLAEAFAERSASTRHRAEAAEVGLIERFEEAAAPFTRKLGDIIFLDDADERLTLGRDGRFLAEVIPEDDETSWRTLRTSQQVTEFYSPEDLFRALAEELERAFPEGADEGAEVAVDALHDLALVWREQSLDAEVTLFAEFNRAATDLARTLGEFAIVDDDDEQLIVNGDGQLSARVLDRSTGAWRELDGPDELVESYDPTDVFADLAAALVEAFPALAVPKYPDEEPEAPQDVGDDPPGPVVPGQLVVGMAPRRGGCARKPGPGTTSHQDQCPSEREFPRASRCADRQESRGLGRRARR
ncbi:MAG: hypothetical protein Q7S35_00620 [Candidatus Limnocylindrales bacterium]|nr:hypothetical protein [Candidatus Limnocylindrales bacterium]